MLNVKFVVSGHGKETERDQKNVNLPKKELKKRKKRSPNLLQWKTCYYDHWRQFITRMILMLLNNLSHLFHPLRLQAGLICKVGVLATLLKL